MQSTVRVTQKMGTLLDATQEGAAYLESIIKATASPFEPFDLSLALKETFTYGLVAERQLLLSLIKTTELCLELLVNSMRFNSYQMFVKLVALLPGDENQKKTLINNKLKKDNYAVVISCIDYQRHDALEPNISNPKLMEELFEKYLTSDDLKALVVRMTHERLEIICQNSSKKVVQMLFLHMPINIKTTLIKAEQFSAIRAASNNPHSDDLALFLLQELNSSISEDHRKELVSMILGVSAKNNRVNTFKTVLAAETNCADEKSYKTKLYEWVSIDNFSLFIDASFTIQDIIIDMFTDELVKRKLLVVSLQWRMYLFGIFRLEYECTRLALKKIVESGEIDEKDIAEIGESKKSLIKELQENKASLFSDKEKRFIDLIHTMKVKEDSLIHNFIHTRSMFMNPSDWTERQARYLIAKIAELKLIVKEILTTENPLVRLVESSVWLTRFFLKHNARSDYQHVTVRLPKLDFIEQQQDLRKLFAAPLPQQLNSLKERIIWADSLDVLLESKTTTKTLYINGDTVHQELAHHLPESRGMSTTNLIVAQMGFVVSRGKKYAGEVKLPSPGREYLSFAIRPSTEMMYVTEESGRAWNETTFYRGLERDVKKVNALLGSKEIIDQTVFTVRYKHSEQALFQFMESPKGIQYIINELKKLKIAAGHKIYAVVLDIRSTQQMCAHCKTRTIGVQNSQADGFIFQLTAALKKENVHVSKRGLMMVTRVSSVEAFENAKDYKNIRGATPDFDANVALTVVPPKPLHTIMNEAGAQKLRNLAHKIRSDMSAEINDRKEFFEKFASGQTVKTQNKENMKSEYKVTQFSAKLPDVKQLKSLHLIETPKKVSVAIYNSAAGKQTGMYTIFSSGSKKVSASSSSSSSSASAAAYSGDLKKVVGTSSSSSSSLSSNATAAAAAQPDAAKLSAASLIVNQSKKRSHDGALKTDTAASTAAGTVFVKK